MLEGFNSAGEHKPYFDKYPEDCCLNCGFLTTLRRESRATISEQPILRPEIPEQTRGNAAQIHDLTPVCFINARALAWEYNEARKAFLDTHPQSAPGQALWGVLIHDRKCEASVIWQPGYTPREHREMLDRKWMIDREGRRDREMREREDRRDEDIVRLQERLHNRELTIIGGGVTFALVTSAIVAAIIEGLLSRGTDLWPF